MRYNKITRICLAFLLAAGMLAAVLPSCGAERSTSAELGTAAPGGSEFSTGEGSAGALEVPSGSPDEKSSGMPLPTEGAEAVFVDRVWRTVEDRDPRSGGECRSFSGMLGSILYYGTNGGYHNLGTCADRFTVNPDSLTMQWESETRANSTANGKNGYVQVDVWVLTNNGYLLLAETSSSQGQEAGKGVSYFTSGSVSYADVPCIYNYLTTGIVNYSHHLQNSFGDNANENYYITFSMSSETGKPSFATHYHD